MSQRTRFAWLLTLCPVLVMACYGDRALLVIVTDGGVIGVGETPMGAAGAGAGHSGAAGTSGAGHSGGAGTFGGAGGSGAAACDPAAVFKKYSCALAGACHDAQNAAGGLDMATVGWDKFIVGRYPSTPTSSALTGMCSFVPTPYLIAGTQPAQGLFLQKLDSSVPCGVQMPSVGAPMTASDRACVQSWANALTAAGPAAPGCDVKPLMAPGKYFCTQAGACHDGSVNTAAGLDLATPGWEQRLIGRAPSGVNASMCGAVKTPYLIAGSRPAQGLLLQKLRDTPPCGQQMPMLGGPMSQADLGCFQRWADALTASAAP